MTTTVSLLLMLGAPVDADVVIRGANVFDGTGPSRRADVALKGDRVVAVGAFEVAGNPRLIDGTGLVVAPGFIDLHTHCDTTGITAPERRQLLNYLTQGVTTVVTGNCGSGPVDVAAYLKQLDDGKVGCNVLHLVPHNAVREKVMGNIDRPPDAGELDAMKKLFEQGMNGGAWGFSSGLEYTPGAYAKTEELVALAKVVAAHGGLYATHMRDEDAGVLISIEEAIVIGRRAGLPVHISHLKCGSKPVWHKAIDAIALIQAARQRGERVTADQYPYRGWSTNMAAALVPPKFRRGTGEEYRARLDDPEQGPLIRQAVAEAIDKYDAGTSFLVARYRPRPEWQGKTLGAIAAAENKPVLDIALEIEHRGGASVVGLTLHEDDVRLIMRQPFVATASDGGSAIPTNESVPHPRSYGTFPRKLGRYAGEDKVISMDHALRSATGLPADIIGLTDRGYLKPGYLADLVVFDPATFRDTATFEKPHQYAPGVKYLFVNGVLAIDDGKPTEALAGRALRMAGVKK
jgi:N-acyl-D-aspartate/D-glutamate deacylase